MNAVQFLRHNDNQALKKLAELMTVNGGMEVKRIVDQPAATNDNRYGRTGLRIYEALELTYLYGAYDMAKANSDASAIAESMRLLMTEAQGELFILVPDEQLTKELTKPWRKKE